MEDDIVRVLNALAGLVWTALADGQVDFVNQCWCEYTGLSVDEARGSGWQAAIHPEDLPGLLARWQTILASGEPGEMEARLRRFDAAYRWFLFRVNPLRDESGEIVKWYGTNIDIEDGKRGEDALHAREISWRQIVDNIPGLVATMGPMGEVEFLNRQTLEYFGKTNVELKDWALSDAVHPDDLPRVIEARKKSIEAGQTYEVEHRCRRADGIYRWFQVRGLPVRNVDGTVTGWYLLLTDIDDLKKADEALQSSERNLSLTINTIPTLIQVSRPDGAILSVNQAVLDYYGVTLRDMQEEDFRSRVYHPDDVERLRGEREEALKRPLQFEYEQRALGKDGKYRWFLVRYNPLLDEQGRIERWYATAFDIEDRKRAEEALRSAERNLNQIINTIPTHIYVLDTEGSVQYVSQAVMDYTGLSLEDVKQEDYRDRVIHPEDFKRVRAPRAAGLRRGAPFSTEQRVLGNDGQYRWFLVRYKPLLDEQGRIDRWYVAAFDIEDRKRAEEALRSAERDLNQIVNTIPALAWSARPDGSAEFFNQQYLDFVGLSAEQVSGWGWIAAVHPDDMDSLSATWAGIMASEGPGEAEARMRGRDGEYRWFLFRASPVRDEQGNIVKWYGTNTDIDDRKRAEALLAGEKRLLEMVAGGDPLLSILDALCLLVEETVSGYICTISLVDTNGAWQVFAAAPNLPPGYNEAIVGRPINPHSGPCAIAAFLKEQVIIADVASDLQWDSSGWGPLTLSYGLRACWSTPILSSENNVLGTFALYSREPGEPTRQLQDVIGQMTHLAAVAIERQRAVERLEAEQEMLGLAQKSARAMAFNWYVQREVNVWSPEQEAFYGLRPGSFDGTYQSWKKLVYPPDWPVMLKAIDHAQETGEVAVEFRAQWPDGSIHWLATNGRMLFDEQDRPFRIVGFTTDITARKLAEEELRRSEAFLAEAQRLSSIGSFSWRVATDEIKWSEHLYRIYELEVGAPLTLELIRTRVHPDDLTLYEKMVGQARNGADNFEWQYRLLMPDGTIKYLHAVAHATRDRDGGLEYIAAVQDVTERRHSEEALGKLQSELAHVSRVATLGALTASIAHEVNQPLSGIITNAGTCMRMLNADPPNLDGARETTRRTLRDGNRASDVITRLRALFGKKDIATEPVDLNEAAREVVALSLSELQSNRVILRTEFADGLPPVTGDRIQLQQVILNLLRNASDAMSGVEDRPRHLTVRTERDDEGVRLGVQDAGVGFDPLAANRLFEAFYTTKNDGMGIGLSVSRSIIESHHGRLWATPNDGPGATFSFSIPCGGELNTKVQ